MTLSIQNIDHQISVQNGSVSVLGVASIRFYSKLMRSFFLYSHRSEPELEMNLQSDEDKALDLNRIEVILNPLLIDFSSRKIQTAILSRFKKLFASDIEFVNSVNKEVANLNRLVQNCSVGFDMVLDTSVQWEASDLVKGLSISIDAAIEDLSTLDLLKKYIEVSSELDLAPFYVFFGLNQVLDYEEIMSFYRHVLQHQVAILDVELMAERPCKNKYCSYLYIDEEFDEFLVKQDYE